MFFPVSQGAQKNNTFPLCHPPERILFSMMQQIYIQNQTYKQLHFSKRFKHKEEYQSSYTVVSSLESISMRKYQGCDTHLVETSVKLLRIPPHHIKQTLTGRWHPILLLSRNSSLSSSSAATHLVPCRSNEIQILPDIIAYRKGKIQEILEVREKLEEIPKA